MVTLICPKCGLRRSYITLRGSWWVRCEVCQTVFHVVGAQTDTASRTAKYGAGEQASRSQTDASG